MTSAAKYIVTIVALDGREYYVTPTISDLMVAEFGLLECGAMG